MNAVSTNFMDGEVIDAKIGVFVDRFNKSMKQTAESILEMGNVIYEASQNLGPVPLSQFCKEIRMDSNNAMFKKLKRIGESHLRLEANVTKLPNNWTTIYKLAVITAEQFAKVVDAEILTPCVTAREINDLYWHDEKSTRRCYIESEFDHNFCVVRECGKCSAVGSENRGTKAKVQF